MKQLHMPDIFHSNKDRYFRCHSEVLGFANNPSRKHGDEVVLIRDVDNYKRGQIGIIRCFNEIQLHQLHNDYLWKIKGSKKLRFPLPDLNATYDFHPIIKRDGRSEVSTWHLHISRFDFKYTQVKQTELIF